MKGGWKIWSSLVDATLDPLLFLSRCKTQGLALDERMPLSFAISAHGC